MLPRVLFLDSDQLSCCHQPIERCPHSDSPPWSSGPLRTGSSRLPEKGPCPAIITPSMGQHADRDTAEEVQRCFSGYGVVFLDCISFCIMFSFPSKFIRNHTTRDEMLKLSIVPIDGIHSHEIYHVVDRVAWEVYFLDWVKM